MNTEQLIAALRYEFAEELKVAAYTKVGMLLAFERAVSRALLRFTEELRK